MIGRESEMEVNNESNGRTINYMARDYDSFLLSMRQLIPEIMPEWVDFEKESDFGNVLLQLFAHMGDILSFYQDRLVNESFLVTAKERRSIIQHLKLISYQLATATPASTTLTLEINADVNDVVRISNGDAFATKSSKDTKSVRFEYIGENQDLDCSSLAVDLITNKKYFQILIEEGKSIKSDVLGNSTGENNQRFQFNYKGLILRSIGSSGIVNRDIKVWTDLGGVIDQEWRLQESLAFSDLDSQDYVIEIDELDQATVIFGGASGGSIIPVSSIVKVDYRIGGGKKGNVAANTIVTITDAPGLNLIGAKVYNPQPATGGAERESIEHAISHAPGVFRSLKRAVTSADYEALALNFNGVGKVRAELVNWNRVTLYIAPSGGGRVSDVLKSNLLAYFEDKRPLSTLIDIKDVDYVKIYLSAEVGIESYYSKEDMRRKVENAVSELLSFEEVDFAQVIYVSKFYEKIEAIEGVVYVTINDFYREGQPGLDDDNGKIKLNASEIPRVPGIAVEDDEVDLEYRAGLKFDDDIEGGY